MEVFVKRQVTELISALTVDMGEVSGKAEVGVKWLG